MNLIWKEGGNIKPKYQNIEAEYQASEDVDLYKFAIASLKGEMPKKAYYKISERIGERLAKDIETLVGFSVADYGNEISPSALQHISNKHGQKGISDQSMQNFHDVAKMRYVIENYDNIREGKISKEFHNKDGSFAKTVEVQKQVGEEFYYVIEAVPDAKTHTLHVVSVYKNKNDTFTGKTVANAPGRYVQDDSQPHVSSVNSSIS